MPFKNYFWLIDEVSPFGKFADSLAACLGC